MRILLANLKHLYQRRYLWFAYAFLGLMLWLSLALSAGDVRERFALIWLVPAIAGILVGGESRDVISRPFARCLPGHPQAVRRVVFLVGPAVMVVMVIVMILRLLILPYDVTFVGGPALWIGVAIVVAWALFGAACFYRTRNRSLAGS
jgi:hypothetical protein